MRTSSFIIIIFLLFIIITHHQFFNSRVHIYFFVCSLAHYYIIIITHHQFLHFKSPHWLVHLLLSSPSSSSSSSSSSSILNFFTSWVHTNFFIYSFAHNSFIIIIFITPPQLHLKFPHRLLSSSSSSLSPILTIFSSRIHIGFFISLCTQFFHHHHHRVHIDFFIYSLYTILFSFKFCPYLLPVLLTLSMS